jgi:hypothetical protein
VFITTRDPALLGKIKELQSAPWPAPLVVESSPTPLLAAFQPNWYVSEIRVDPTPLLDPRVEKMMGKYQEAPPPKQ